MPHEEEEHPDTILSEVLSASLGGAVSASVLFPLEVLKTRMQSSNSSSSNSSSDEDGDEGRESSHGGMVEYAKKRLVSIRRKVTKSTI